MHKPGILYNIMPRRHLKQENKARPQSAAPFCDNAIKPETLVKNTPSCDCGKNKS